MMTSKPFGRALAIAAMITAALQSANPQIAMQSIPTYRSRGKGRGLRQASRHTVAQDRRAAIKAKKQTETEMMETLLTHTSDIAIRAREIDGADDPTQPVIIPDTLPATIKKRFDQDWNYELYSDQLFAHATGDSRV